MFDCLLLWCVQDHCQCWCCWQLCPFEYKRSWVAGLSQVGVWDWGYILLRHLLRSARADRSDRPSLLPYVVADSAKRLPTSMVDPTSFPVFVVRGLLSVVLFLQFWLTCLMSPSVSLIHFQSLTNKDIVLPRRRTVQCGVRIPVGTGGFPLFQKFETSCAAHQPPVKWVPGFFPWDIVAGSWMWPLLFIQCWG